MCKGCGSNLEHIDKTIELDCLKQREVTEIKRTDSGSIDYEYYSKQSKKERSKSFFRFIKKYLSC